jgi:hypothetical protein
MYLEQMPYMEYENLFLARAVVLHEQEVEMKKNHPPK